MPCLELWIPFNCCKCTVFWIKINQKNRTFSRLYKSIKFICSALLDISQTQIQLVKFLPFHIPSTPPPASLLKLPFSRSLDRCCIELQNLIQFWPVVSREALKWPTDEAIAFLIMPHRAVRHIIDPVSRQAFKMAIDLMVSRLTDTSQ